MAVRVAIDVGPLHGERTGIGHAVSETVDALDRHRSDVELRPYVTSMRASLGVGTRRLPLPALVAHRIWARRSWPPMDRFLGDVDVVHGTNYVVPPTSRIARVVSVYDCWFLDHPGDVVADVRRAGLVLRRAIADGTRVVTSSRATADALLAHVAELDPGRVDVVHLGPPPPQPDRSSSDVTVPEPPPRLSDLGGTPFVLALGTVERRKNLPLLVEAFARLATDDADVRLVVAGAWGDDAERVTSAVARLPVAVRARVRLLGRVDDPERAWLLAAADVLAYPSLDEGFGFPILEAQACGVPVVATAVGSIPEVGGPSLMLSRPDDPLALAANLYATLHDDRRRTDAIERGRTNVGRFSWQRCADELADIYRRSAEEIA